MNDNKIRNKFTEMSKIFKDVIDEYESLKSENVMLKEENEGLKEELDIAIYENKVLKEENEGLNLILEDFGECDNERRKLKEEIELQKDYIDALPDNCEQLKDEVYTVNAINHSLEEQIKKHKEAYALMSAEKNRRYNELKLEKENLEAKERYNVLDGKNSL